MIFVADQPSIRNYTGWKELSQLPFVTTIETAEGNSNNCELKRRRKIKIFFQIDSSPCCAVPLRGYQRLKGKGTVQRDVERNCLKLTRNKGFRFVHISDADEFLWLSVNESIKEFLSRQPLHLHYFSFGKYMYDLKHYVEDVPDSGYG